MAFQLPFSAHAHDEAVKIQPFRRRLALDWEKALSLEITSRFKPAADAEFLPAKVVSFTFKSKRSAIDFDYVWETANVLAEIAITKHSVEFAEDFDYEVSSTVSLRVFLSLAKLAKDWVNNYVYISKDGPVGGLFQLTYATTTKQKLLAYDREGRRDEKQIFKKMILQCIDRNYCKIWPFC